MCHQHSPCANDSPNPYEEKFFIPGIVTTSLAICLPLDRPPTFLRRTPQRPVPQRTLTALDATSGNKLWTKKRPAKGFGTFGIPAANADGSLVLVTSQTRDATGPPTLTLHAFAPRTGDAAGFGRVYVAGRSTVVALSA
ncbi:hypothetical protein [Streptomyces milbemycinicus]